MDLTAGKAYSPSQSLLPGNSSLASAYCLPSSLVPHRDALTKSLFPSGSQGLASPAYSGSLSTTLSSPHTSYSNGHSITSHIPKSLDAAVKSYTSPAPVFNRHTKESFPYGISGVPMPSYGYHGDVYQFTSNGYPRKSRTCSYCGKVFTRSTTRRYHEKRCPLLRAAVSSYMGKDTSSGAPASQSRSLAAEFTPPGYKGPGPVLGPSISGINLSSDSQEIATSVLGTSPSEETRRGEVDASLFSGYQTSVIVKQEPHETETLRTSSDHKQTFAQETLDSVARFSPESDDSNKRGSMNLSPVYSGGIDLSKSPLHTSTPQTDEDGMIISAEFIHEQYKLRSESGMANHGGLSSLSAHDIVSLQHARYNIELTAHDGSEVVDDTNEGSVRREMANTKDGEFNDDASIEMASTGSTTEKKIYTTHKCGICGKCFENSGKLHLHEQLHTKFKPYSCKFCDMKFAKAAQRVEHEKMHNGSGDSTHICAVCGSSFTRKYSLKLHMRRWHQEGPWLCRHCGKASLTQIELKTHLYSHNLPRMERESLLYMPDVALNYSAMGSRDDSSPSDGNEYSGLTSTSAGGGSSGTATIINNTAEIVVGQETEMCQECGRDFPKGYMRYHLKSHEAQKPYSCPICAKRFGYKNNMKSHIKLHTGVKPFQCKICGAKFTRGSTLRRHARRHGIIADSVWDLFVKPNYSRSGGGQNQSRPSAMEHTSATSNRADSPAMVLANQLCPVPTDAPEPANYLDASMSPPSTCGSLYPLYASLGQIPPPGLYSALQSSTSYLSQHLPQGRAAAPYQASSQPAPPQQSDALNLSIQKPPDIHSDQSTVSRSRSRSLSGSESQPYLVQPSGRAARHSVGVQVHLCCPPESIASSTPPDNEAGLSSATLLSSATSTLPGAAPDSPSSMAMMPYVVTSPSQRPSNLDSTSPALSVSSVKDYSLETIASLISSGRMFKCFHCECYFSEYAMYRIHAKLHSQDFTKPFVCLVCGEDCHDRVYFALHLSEHLR